MTVDEAYHAHGCDIAALGLGPRGIASHYGLSLHRARLLAARIRQDGPPAPVEEADRGSLPGIRARYPLAPTAGPAAGVDASGDVSSARNRPDIGNVGDRLTDDGGEDERTIEATGWRIQTLSDLLDAAEIDPAEWVVRSWTANTWEAQRAGGGVQELWQVKAHLERRLARGLTVPPLAAPIPRRPDPAPEGPRTIVLIPDSQHGYRWTHRHTRLEPMHDRAACDVVTQLIGAIDPDEVVLLGDMLDLAPWSTKYRRPLSVRDTTSPALAELQWQLLQWVDAAPRAPFTYLEGNHEARITNALVEQLAEAAATLPVGESQPLYTVPRLLRLDELGVEYLGPYGAGVWLHDALYIAHGDRVRSKGGQTAAAYLADATHSVAFGHTHRLELAQRTIRTITGPRVLSAFSPGCLCRTDGSVPGVSAHPDWQHGIAVVYIDGEHVHPHLVPIVDGRAVWGGRVYVGEDRGDEIAEATGWPQMAS